MIEKEGGLRHADALGFPMLNVVPLIGMQPKVRELDGSAAN
jgi:hypothetical protein